MPAPGGEAAERGRRAGRTGRGAASPAHLPRRDPEAGLAVAGAGRARHRHRTHAAGQLVPALRSVTAWDGRWAGKWDEGWDGRLEMGRCGSQNG